MKKAVALLIILSLTKFYCDAQVLGDEKVNSSANLKRASKIIIRYSDSVYVRISVKVLDQNNIEVKSTFLNFSANDFLLYKPLLPADSLLREGVFRISLYKDGHPLSRVRFKDSSEGIYYEGSRQFNPSVIPNLEPENFVRLPAKDSIVFSINLADFYEFKSPPGTGEKEYYLDYVANMPLISSDYKQKFEYAKKKKSSLKPVFIAMTMKKTVVKDNYFSGVTKFTLVN